MVPYHTVCTIKHTRFHSLPHLFWHDHIAPRIRVPRGIVGLGIPALEWLTVSELTGAATKQRARPNCCCLSRPRATNCRHSIHSYHRFKVHLSEPQ